MSELITIITATDPVVKNKSLDDFCRDAALETLLAETLALEAFRKEETNLYNRVRALFFLYAIHRFYIPIQHKIGTRGMINLDNKLERAMDALRCPPEDWKVENLSGGERRRVALCRLLLRQPDVLLLDEPTNHLDAESVEWLEHHLQQYAGTVIAITHDRYFLDNVSGWINRARYTGRVLCTGG